MLHLEQLTNIEEVIEAYGNYVDAMKKRRSYVLDFERFMGLTAPLLSAIYDRNKGYYYDYDSEREKNKGCYIFNRSLIHLFHDNNRDLYFVSHFAPSSMREGVEIIKNLSKEESNIVFAVTSDLVSMVEKCGFVNTGVKQDHYFGDEIVEKTILVSNHLLENVDLEEYFF